MVTLPFLWDVVSCRKQEMQRVKSKLEACGHPRLAEMFARTYMSTISTTAATLVSRGTKDVVPCAIA
eukprot:2785991-Amphidinium_carterae.2